MYSPSKDKFQNIQVGLSLSWCNGWMRTTMCRWNFFIVPMLGIKKIRYYIIFFFLDKFCYILNSMIPIKKLKKNSASSNNNKIIPSLYIQNIFYRAQCLTFFSPLAYSILTHCMSPRAYLIEKKLKNSSLLFFCSSKRIPNIPTFQTVSSMYSLNWHSASKYCKNLNVKILKFGNDTWKDLPRLWLKS